MGEATFEVLALCGQVWYSSRRKISKVQPAVSLAPDPRIRRFSSAVEQRFCKPKVGSSILSTGTSDLDCRSWPLVALRRSRAHLDAIARIAFEMSWQGFTKEKAPDDARGF